MTHQSASNLRQITPGTVDAIVLAAHEGNGVLSPFAVNVNTVNHRGITIDIGDQEGPLLACGGAMLAVATYVGARLSPANVTMLARALRGWADRTAAAPIAVTPRTAHAVDTSPGGHVIVQSPTAHGLLFANLGTTLHLWPHGASELNAPLTTELADHLESWVASVGMTMGGVN